MKIIEATWEKRNLGLETVEIEFDSADFLANKDAMATTIKKMESMYQYIVIKLPRNQIEANTLLQELGYVFVETQFTIKKKLSEVAGLRLSNYIDDLDVEQIFDKQRILRNMDDTMFETDRIALDKRLGKELANKRYRNWIKDLNSETNLLYVMMDKAIDIGFFTISTNSSKIADLPLGGIYSDHKRKGYGIALIYYPMLLSKQLSYTYTRTKVSSNNKEVLDLYLFLGYSVGTIQYVFTKMIR